MKVGFISLGCNKNLVDTEKTIALFKDHNFEIVNNVEEAEIIVINTCGFIEKAKEEAINTILEMAEYKKKNCKYLIAMGCLVERYKNELEKSIPEVDLYIKYSSYNNIWEKIEALINNEKIVAKADDKKNYENNEKNNDNNEKCKDNEKICENNEKYKNKESKLEAEPFDEYNNRVITTGNNYAYIKIADGCSNRCTYCAIPYIRGPLKSRKIESIIEEANKLAKEGYKEIILTAQDTTKYGIDIYGKPMLAELLEKLSKIEKIKWIRFLYAYPETITKELIEVIKQNPKICHYFDIPIQHISNSVLKRMNRQSNGKRNSRCDFKNYSNGWLSGRN